MGGSGTRFCNKEFHVPKPLIDLNGKPFFYWATQSVLKYVETKDIIFVILKEHAEKFKLDEIIQKYYPDALIHIIPEVLNGALLTCIEGLKKINDDFPILFNDCDHAFFSREFQNFCNNGFENNPDAALLTFKSNNPCYSYVKFDNCNNVIGTVEKQAVSNNAICGAYYFKNKNIFLSASEKYLQNCQYKEFFVSGVYNCLDKTQNIRIFNLDKHISFGTPEEYEQATKNNDLENLI